MTKEDCCFTCGNQWFRYRAAAVIIEDGCVLFVKNENEADDYYYSVGGGVHLGEKAEDAVLREVFEETGVPYEIDRLLFLHENFFTGSGSLAGYECHEIAFYYLMKSRGTKELKSDSYTTNSMGTFKENMHWLPICELKKYKAFPSFFAEELLDIPETVKHIVTDER
ncbi:NUDIX hydrolase [Roseburia sp. 499]|uniref:NUDIX hydrolase n=1 Tax=Roseburia sp. 499 TaxID=1261634 RepID=UPI0009530925|nr:NUDIX domain-containing protein [Roseburia sp. 499]WVK68580.1 NUDIX domain-containing protein [Roseburia sp. 499]